MQPPTHGPFDRFARAVQAHAMHLIGGGTLEGAEQAAMRASGGLFNEAVAQASLAARAAAAGLQAAQGEIAADTPIGGGGIQQPGVGEVVITARFRMIPGGQGAAIWRTVQVGVPITATQAEAQAALLEDAADLAAGEEDGYAGILAKGEFADVFDVATIVGIL